MRPYSANIMSAHLTFLRTQSLEVKGMKAFLKQFCWEVSRQLQSTCNTQGEGLRRAAINTQDTVKLPGWWSHSVLTQNKHVSQITLSELHSWSLWGRRYQSLVCVKDIRNLPIRLQRPTDFHAEKQEIWKS